MNEISEEDWEKIIRTLKSTAHEPLKDSFWMYLYCERCKEVHIFTKDTDVECIDSLGLDFTSLKQ